MNMNGVGPQGATETEITAIDLRNITRITTNERRHSKHWDNDRRGVGVRGNVLSRRNWMAQTWRLTYLVPLHSP